MNNERVLTACNAVSGESEKVAEAVQRNETPSMDMLIDTLKVLETACGD
jgi:hypothetical protein